MKTRFTADGIQRSENADDKPAQRRITCKSNANKKNNKFVLVRAFFNFQPRNERTTALNFVSLLFDVMVAALAAAGAEKKLINKYVVICIFFAKTSRLV